MKTIIRQMHTPVVALAVLLVLGILFNACGGSSQGSGQTTSTTPTSSALSKPTQAGPAPTTTEHVPTPTAAACGTQLSGVTYLSVDATAQASAGGGGTQALQKGDMYGVIVPASDAAHPVTIQINYSTHSESCSFYSTRRIGIVLIKSKRLTRLCYLTTNKQGHVIPFRSALFMTPHCLRQFARVLCGMRTLPLRAAKSASHTKPSRTAEGSEGSLREQPERNNMPWFLCC